ncbi:MAG: TetR/AcrR family transcriptional regulator [Nevskia sp.]|nr:TetR/AcrR family transcriptional regulator [Nevskia sp.]
MSGKGRTRIRRTQGERSAETVGRLMATARELFASRGFAGTSLDDILEAVSGSRGALYHHFDSKKDLFRAVFEEQERLLTDVIVAAARRERSAWAAFMAGCEAFLAACTDPAVQQIILLDAPAVLGWETMRSVESRYVLTMVQEGIAGAIREGTLRPRAVEPLAHFILGGLSECAMAIARSGDPASAMRDARVELRRLLEALK